MLLHKKKAQSTLEFIILTTIILGVFLTMSNYFKRGVSGRWKAAVDDLGDQYDPRFTNTSIRQVLVANTMTIVTTVPGSLYGENGVWTMRTDQTNSIETKSGGTVVGAF